MSENAQNQEMENKKDAVHAGKKTDSLVHDISILVVITLAAGALLGAAYTVTRAPVARAQAAAKEEAQRTVMQEADSFAALAGAADAEESDGAALMKEVGARLEEKGLTGTAVEQIDQALDAQGGVIGYVVTCTNSEGYGGDVELMCGVSADEEGTLTIRGISFLALSETAGMGMRAKDTSFLEQFPGKMIREGETFAYTKSGNPADNEIDVISGCTVTTNAVTKDVCAALEAVNAALQSGGAPDAKEGQEG